MRKWGALSSVIHTQELLVLACIFNSVYEHPAESVGSFSETLSSGLFYTAANKPGSERLQRMTFLIFWLTQSKKGWDSNSLGRCSHCGRCYPVINVSYFKYKPLSSFPTFLLATADSVPVSLVWISLGADAIAKFGFLAILGLGVHLWLRIQIPKNSAWKLLILWADL